MTDPTDVAVSQWQQSRARVVELVRGASPDDLSRRVPACPDWSCLDLLRHVVGLAADVLDGDEPEDHSEAWTQRQVERRRDHGAERVLEEWASLSDPLVAWMREHGTRPLNDVVIHEQDLRGGLGVAGARETDGLRIVRERLLGRLEERLDAGASLALVGETWQWSSGGHSEAAVVLAASDFDLTRAVMSRRTPEQLASYVVRGDLAPYLRAFAVLGALPSEPIPE